MLSQIFKNIFLKFPQTFHTQQILRVASEVHQIQRRRPISMKEEIQIFQR